MKSCKEHGYEKQSVGVNIYVQLLSGVPAELYSKLCVRMIGPLGFHFCIVSSSRHTSDNCED